LADDPGLCRCDPQPGTFNVPVGLDEDLWRGSCGAAADAGSEEPGVLPDPTTGLPTLTIRERSRTYYEADGAPRYDWTDLVIGPTLALEARIEVNDATGQTRVTASAVVAYSGERVPDETAVALDSRGWRWDITSCRTLPGRLEMALERISDAE
jgi:hypothetical protein